MDRASIYHLFGRYPILEQNSQLLTWLSANGCLFWYEEKEKGLTRVYVIAYDEGSLLITDINTSNAILENFDNPNTYSVVATRAFDISNLPSVSEARKTLLREGVSFGDIISIKYLVSKGEDGSEVPDLVIEVKDKNGIAQKSFTRRNDPTANKLLREAPTRFERSDDVHILNDWLAANDLHSPYLFKAEADGWTAGPLTVREKARRIAFNVSSTYRYDGSINLISEFTWRDTLVRDRNGRRGICDEYAVVQISYLRSILIPARMKFLIWTTNGQGVGHACVEFLDQGRWIHMDGLWSAFDNPGRDEPNDARSTTPAWGNPIRPETAYSTPMETLLFGHHTREMRGLDTATSHAGARWPGSPAANCVPLN